MDGKKGFGGLGGLDCWWFVGLLEEEEDGREVCKCKEMDGWCKLRV